jgi:hypothetical protein|tara:strand:+ start:512 stop:1408 length:897 start_codon:yes stop_codon:yes gene_type:complete
MKYCETLYLNCESNFIPELHNSDVIRFDNRNYHAYGTFTALLGHLFFKAYRIQDNGLLKQPYSASIILPKIEKFKPEDPEDNLTRIKYILNNFVPPKYGIIVSIYEAMEHIKCLTPFDSFVNWPFKMRWESNLTKEFVLIQDVKTLKNNKNYDYNRILNSYHRIIKEVTSIGLNWKIVNYSTSLPDVFWALLHCKCFFSWSGGIYYLAGGTNTPTLGFGNNPYVQIDNYATFKPPGRTFDKKLVRTAWGETHFHPGRILMYKDKFGLYQGPQEHVTNIGNVESKEELNIMTKQLLEKC